MNRCSFGHLFARQLTKAVVNLLSRLGGPFITGQIRIVPNSAEVNFAATCRTETPMARE